jgi:tetratricopeptide (TPR) repeat protein
MEKGFSRIKGNKDLYCWALSNLGDMYGHAGRIEEAYRAYLSVLQKDSNYNYALKGIAWITLSHDKNFKEAKRIISVLASRSRMPDANLMLAEIAELQQEEQEKNNQLQSFITMTDNIGYKTMYAKYLAELYAEDLNQPEKSLAIAEEEINNRPTPQSFDLKAWALLHLGRNKEALVIAQKYVEDRTFEPDAAYHLGIIYKANGFGKEAEKYLEKAMECSFELGPGRTKKIQEALNNL